MYDVTVYCTNGQQAKVSGVREVKTETDRNQMVQGIPTPVLICRDGEDTEVGRFRWAQIDGYSVNRTP